MARIIGLIMLIGLTAVSLVTGTATADEKRMESAKVTAMPATQAEIGKPAPDFTLVGADGESYTLSSFKDMYVVLEWVNFDCPFVKKHYGSGNMQGLQKEYTGKEVVWLSICSSAPGKQGFFNGDDLTERLKNEGSKATAYLLDSDGKVGKMYGAKTTPNMFVIDPKGTLVYAGAIDDKPSFKQDDIAGAQNYVRLALDSAMKGKPVEVSSSEPYGCSVKYQ